MTKTATLVLVILLLQAAIIINACKDSSPVSEVPTEPEVTITSPADNSIIVDNTIIEISATDDHAVVKVEVYIDGVLDSTRVLVAPPFQYAWLASALSEGSTHTLQARAYDADGAIGLSAPVRVTIRKFQPPSRLRIVAVTDSTATLDWVDGGSMEEQYEVEASTTSSNFTVVATVGQNLTSATVPAEFIKSSVYLFRVRGIGHGFTSAYSNTVSTLLAAPTNLTLVSISEESVTLRWSDENTFESGYEIQQSTDGVNFSTVKSTGSTIKRVTVTGAFYSDITYYFRMRTISLINASPYSPLLTALLRFDPPTNVSVTAIHGTAISVEWQDNSTYETGFIVEASTDNLIFTEVQQAGENDTTALIGGLSTGTPNHYFRVRARTTINTSEPSNTIRLYFVSEMIAGGQFTAAGSLPAAYIARWDGFAWLPLSTGISGTGSPIVNALAVFDNDLYLGGSFSTAGSVNANSVARWDGNDLSSVGDGVGNVALAVAGKDNYLYVGGRFTSAGGADADYVARWDGNSWTNAGAGMDGYVYSLLSYGGSVVAGGGFRTVGNTNVNYIASLSGSSWSPLGSGMNGAVDALAVYGSDLYAGGYFTSAGGVHVNNLARWNGSSWTGVGGGMNAFVEAFAVFNSELYAGGGFTRAGATDASYVARWNGSSWSAVGPGMNGPVFCFAVFKGELYAGGAFTRAGAAPANNIAKWDGAQWLPVGSGMNEAVRTLTVYPHWLWESLP